MLNMLSYWAASKHGPKKFILVYEDGTKRIDLTDYNWRGKIDFKREVIGMCAKLPVDGTWSIEFVGPEGTCRTQGTKTAKAAVAKLLKERKKAFAADAELKSNPMKWLERELSVHDWTHAFSDDYRYVVAGEHHWKLIQSIIEKCPVKADAEALVKKYQEKHA